MSEYSFLYIIQQIITSVISGYLIVEYIEKSIYKIFSILSLSLLIIEVNVVQPSVRTVTA